MDLLKELQPFATAITILAVLILLLCFKGELKQLIRVLERVRFQKTKDGYAVQASEPVQPPEPAQAKGKITEKAESENAGVEKEKQKDEKIEEKKQGEGNKVEKKSTWINAFIKNDYKETVDLLEKEIPVAAEEEGKLHLRSVRAYCIYKLNPSEGDAKFEELLREHPSKIDIYEWWLIALREAKRYDKVHAVIDQGMKRVVDPVPMLKEKIQSLREQKQFDAAEVAGLAAIQTHVYRTELHYELAQIYKDRNKNAQAVQVLESALEVKPDDVLARSSLAELFRNNNAHQHAALHYTELTKLRPRDASYAGLLGNALLELKFNDRAMYYYRRADELAEGKQEWIVANIGNTLKNRGLFCDAIGYLQRSVQIDPNSEYAHRRLAEAMKDRDDEINKLTALMEETEDRHKTPLPESLRVQQNQ